MIVYKDQQGTPEWRAARRGVITGSRFRDALTKDRSGKGLGDTAKGYAMDLAREIIGGSAPEIFPSSAMRKGTEEEPNARFWYEMETGSVVDEAGFITTDDGKFGVSVDGLVDEDGIIEIKTMVSSKTLFTAVCDEDHAEYLHQINGGMWLLGRKWCDLVLWVPDLKTGFIHRIERDEEQITQLEDGLIQFDKLVQTLVEKLKGKVNVVSQ